jgi:hypothetical protein
MRWSCRSTFNNMKMQWAGLLSEVSAQRSPGFSTVSSLYGLPVQSPLLSNGLVRSAPMKEAPTNAVGQETKIANCYTGR